MLVCRVARPLRRICDAGAEAARDVADANRAVGGGYADGAGRAADHHGGAGERAATGAARHALRLQALRDEAAGHQDDETENPRQAQH